VEGMRMDVVRAAFAEPSNAAFIRNVSRNPLQPLRNQASSTVWQGAMARRKHADHVL